MSTFRAARPAKLCMDCFSELYPGQMPGTFTWGRECTKCHKPTPSLARLVKIDAADVPT